MQGKLFQKMAGKHNFSQEAFAAFPESLFDPIGVFYDRMKKNHVVIIDVKVPNQEGVIKNALVAIEVKVDKDVAEVCDIITAFSLNKSDYLKKFISSPVYVDKKRAEVWAGAEEGNILQLLSTALSELGSEVIMRDKLAEVNDKIYQISNEDDIQFAERLRVAVASLGNDGFMKAPNGMPCKLTPNQWTQVRTPELKAWFGDWENGPEERTQDSGRKRGAARGVLCHGWWVYGICLVAGAAEHGYARVLLLRRHGGLGGYGEPRDGVLPQYPQPEER